MSSEGSSSRLPSRVVLAAAAGTVVAAGAAYYLYSRADCARGNTPVEEEISFNDLKKWKEEGNTHFIQKRFPEAIECFSRVIDELNKSKKHDKNVNSSRQNALEYADLLAVCYQNRAAAKQSCEESPLEVISDCSHAIALKPQYGKAYMRRAGLLKVMEPKQALSDALAAMHLDAKFAEQLGGVMGELMESLEKKNREDFERRKAGGAVKRPQKITHDQLYNFMYKTTSDERVRKMMVGSIPPLPCLKTTVILLSKRDIEGALAEFVKREEPECLLLSARFHFYRGSLDEFEESLAKLEKWLSSSADHEFYTDIQISYALLRLETADSVAAVLELMEAAISAHGPLADFFSAAAYRCIFHDAYEQAVTILSDSRLEHSVVSQVLFYFSSINSILLKNENPMDAFKVIAKFEEFTDTLNDESVDKNWAAFALSKVYATFQNFPNAEALMMELMRRDPGCSIYPIAMAHAYTQMGKYKEANEMADRALNLEKICPEAHLLKQSLKLHSQGNKLEPASVYVSLRAEAEPLLTRCLSNSDFHYIPEVLRHISFIEAKIAAANSLGL